MSEKILTREEIVSLLNSVNPGVVGAEEREGYVVVIAGPNELIYSGPYQDESVRAWCSRELGDWLTYKA